MALSTCPVTPSKAGYATQRQTGAIIQTKLDGGKSASRLDQLGAADLVTLSWDIDATTYDTLMAWFEDTLIMGSLPFTAALILRTSTPSNYTCQFLDGTFGLQSHQGDQYIVGGQVEAVTNA